MDLQTRINLIRCYYQRNMSPTDALRQYQTENNLRKPPCTLQAMINLCNKFNTTGSVWDKEKSGRPDDNNDEKKEKVAEGVRTVSARSSWSVSSVREVSKETGLSKSTIHRIMKRKLNLSKWKISITQQLEPDDYKTRKEFANWFLESMIDNIDNVIWSDEAYFHLNSIVYTKNAYIWAEENPHATTEKPLHSPKICVWVGFSGNIIIPPVIIKEGTVDGDKYHEILLNHLIPFLKRHRRCSSSTFQQDGAPPHIKRNVKELLQKTFTDDRIISRHFPNIWPPRSPDLSPVDFWYWGNLKRLVYSTGNPRNIEELEQRIINAAEKITIDDVRNANNSFLERLQWLLDVDGAHFEHYL